MKAGRLFMRSFLVIVTVVFVAPVQLSAGLLISLDVDASDAPASETQSGYTRMTEAGMIRDGINGFFEPTATVNGVTVTANSEVSAGFAGQGFRDRDILSGTVPPPPVQNVLRDFIFSEGVNNAEIDVTIQNLPTGIYEITTFHNDWNIAGAPPEDRLFDIFVTDALGADQLKVDNATYTNSVSSYNGETYFVQSNGTDNIVIRIIEDSATTNSVRFNGLTITAVPEPSSITLLGMGVVGLVGYGWRRRRKLCGSGS